MSDQAERHDYVALIGPDDPRHGSTNGYVNYLCRCGPCTSAKREYDRGFRARRVEAGLTTMGTVPKRRHALAWRNRDAGVG